jgi:hypothetical protein
MPRDGRRELSKIGDNMALYTLIGRDPSGWIWITPDLEAQEVDRSSWGIPPQSSVQLTMKITGVIPMIMKNGMLVIYLDVDEVEVETTSQKCEWPEYSSGMSPVIFGANEVRITNTFQFPVKVGLRSLDKGRDSIVPSKGEMSFFVPDDSYDIYFQYAVDAGNLYQGESFDLSSSNVEIQLKMAEDGDFEIRRVN